MSVSAAPPRAKLDATTCGLGGLIVGMAALTTWDQWAIWSTKDDYGFGYLVPAFAAYVLWDRWDELHPLLTGQRTLVSGPTAPWLLRTAQVLTFFALLTFGLGAMARAIFGTGALPTLAIAFGLTVTALGFTFLSVRGQGATEPSAHARWAATGLMLFPASIWLISGPFLYLIDNQIKGELLTNVVEVVSGILRVSGHAIRVSGNTINFPNGDAVGVADACSGIRSLSACVFAGAFLGALYLEGGFPGQLLRRVSLLGLSAFLAILINIGRNTFLTFYALQHGSSSLDQDFAGRPHGQPDFSSFGTIHDLAGNVAMVGALLILIACLPLLNRIGRPPTPLTER